MLVDIVPPTDCPSCGAGLTFANDLLYCFNVTCCAQRQKKIEHFSKTLKIKGLGPASIEKLNLQDFDEVYSISLDYITKSLGSEKLATKLYDEIKNSHNAPLELVLPAFGIPLIGKSATKKLSDTVECLTQIDINACQSAGLGPKATDNLLTWLDEEFYSWYDGQLPFDFKFSSTSRSSNSSMGTVCISGRLKSFKTKALATEALEKLGYRVKDNFTRDVTVFVNESGIESSKTKQARESGIIIITDLKSFLEKQ